MAASNAPFTSYLPQAAASPSTPRSSTSPRSSRRAPRPRRRRRAAPSPSASPPPPSPRASAGSSRHQLGLAPCPRRRRRGALYDLLASPDVARAAPDVVLVVGGRLVSKRLQALVERRSVACVMVDSHAERHDPAHCVTHRLAGDVAAILAAIHAAAADATRRRPPAPAAGDASAALDAALADALDAALEPTAGIGEEEVAPTPPTATRSRRCRAAAGGGLGGRRRRERRRRGGLPRLAVAEAWVARQVCAVLCGRSDERRRQGRRDAARCDDLLFCSNSLPIRHLDMFCAAAPTVLSNRGASGIDGILHTALGAALGGAAGGGSATCLIGDLAALHDLNALGPSNTAAHRRRRRPQQRGRRDLPLPADCTLRRILAVLRHAARPPLRGRRRGFGLRTASPPPPPTCAPRTPPRSTPAGRRSSR